MKKSEILKLLEKRFEYLPKSEVERTVEKILHFFTLKLSQGKRIELRDFGTFTTKIRKARKGRNPSTGIEIDINGIIRALIIEIINKFLNLKLFLER